MAIIINDEAKKLLKDKNKNYILVSLFQQACWGGGVNKVIGVSIASKFDKELYSKYVVDGVDVYIDYRLNINEEAIPGLTSMKPVPCPFGLKGGVAMRTFKVMMSPSSG